MGEHRNSGGTRGIAKGPLIAVGTVVVLVLAVLGWFQLRDRISDQGIQAADTCVEGDQVVAVSADPAVADQVAALARSYTDTRPVVRDHCITLDVTSAETDAVAAALAAGGSPWDEAALGPIPSLWIPDSSNAIAALAPGTVDGTPRSVARTPIVLAGPSEAIDALQSADVGWADLPALQRATGAFGSADAPPSPDGVSWGGLRLHLPVGPDSYATAATLGAIADATDSAPDTPTPDDVRREPLVSALTGLAITDGGVAAVTPDSTDSALADLGADLTPAADFHLVPTAEQHFGAVPRPGLATYAPTGPSVFADYPAAVLSGQWTDETTRRAAAQFEDFVLRPENAQPFVDAGFVADPDRSSAAPVLAPDVRDAMVAVLQDPPTPRRATVLLDISGSMDTAEGPGTRLQNTIDALTRQFDVVSGTAELGLWVYSNDIDGDRAFRAVVPTGPVDEALLSGTRRSELIAAVGSLEPAAATSTYESVTAAYMSALDGFAPRMPNRVLLVTDGPDDDGSVTSERFLDVLSAMTDPTRPVAIDVVSIGTNSDIGTLQSMSDVTGGTLTTVASSAGSELPDLLRKLLY